MDALDRMFKHLVRTIRANHPAYLTQPFEVGDLHQKILPFRHFRRELLLESNEEYEFTMTQLLSGARGYLMVDDRMREALERELASPNPDTEAFRRFADLHVTLAPAALERELTPVEAQPRVTPSDASQIDPALRALPPTVRISTPDASPPIEEARCGYCKGLLPPGHRVVFCPHCGQNLTVLNCSACGVEMEVGWKYCVACGRASGREE
jgi:hypothetical protein